jgi:hypothetical protein
MARKRNLENDVVVSSGAAAAPVRRQTAAARPKHSPTTAEIPAVPIPEAAMDTASAASTIDYEPSREEIARLAFLYWEARGGQGGSPDEDWLRAEQELRKRALAVAL